MLPGQSQQHFSECADHLLIAVHQILVQTVQRVVVRGACRKQLLTKAHGHDCLTEEVGPHAPATAEPKDEIGASYCVATTLLPAPARSFFVNLILSWPNSRTRLPIVHSRACRRVMCVGHGYQTDGTRARRPCFYVVSLALASLSLSLGVRGCAWVRRAHPPVVDPTSDEQRLPPGLQLSESLRAEISSWPHRRRVSLQLH